MKNFHVFWGRKENTFSCDVYKKTLTQEGYEIVDPSVVDETINDWGAAALDLENMIIRRPKENEPDDVLLYDHYDEVASRDIFFKVSQAALKRHSKEYA